MAKCNVDLSFNTNGCIPDAIINYEVEIRAAGSAVNNPAFPFQPSGTILASGSYTSVPATVGSVLTDTIGNIPITNYFITGSFNDALEIDTANIAEDVDICIRSTSPCASEDDFVCTRVVAEPVIPEALIRIQPSTSFTFDFDFIKGTSLVPTGEPYRLEVFVNGSLSETITGTLGNADYTSDRTDGLSILDFSPTGDIDNGLSFTFDGNAWDTAIGSPNDRLWRIFVGDPSSSLCKIESNNSLNNSAEFNN